jgi:hypothetical protein
MGEKLSKGDNPFHFSITEDVCLFHQQACGSFSTTTTQKFMCRYNNMIARIIVL